jgi:hypothetical protein
MKLPAVRRTKKTRSQRALETAQSALQVYTSLKVAKAGPKAAKAVAKGYAGAKAAKGTAKIGSIVAVPIVIGTAAFIMVKRRGSGGSDGFGGPGGGGPELPHDPPVTPAAPPVSTNEGAPKAGEPSAPRSGTTAAS